MANEQPRRPPSAYFLWLSAKREDIAKSLGTGKGPEVSKEAGKLWKQLTEEEKKPFEVQAKTLRSEYDKKMILFKAQGGVVTKKRPLGDDAKEGKPRRPVGGAYGCFLAAKRSEIAKNLPEGHKMTDVGKAAGEMWRGLLASEKKPYEEDYAKKLTEYREAKEAYDAEHEGLLDLIALAKPRGLRDQFYPTFQKVGQIMDVTLVPYGNAEEHSNGSEWSFTCQHGPQECVGNLIETCAISILQNVTAYFPFIHCVEVNIESGDPRSVAQRCASQQGIDFTAIDKCQSGPQGNSLEHEMALKTNALNPRHYYVPWVTLNGKHTEDIQEKATFNLLGLVCDTYQGSKPSACRGNVSVHNRCYMDA